MDRCDLRQAVKLELGIPVVSEGPADGLLTDDRLNLLIDRALVFISTERRWDWLVTSTPLSVIAGTDSYALPADCIDVLDVVDSNGFGLTHVAPRDRNNVFRRPTAASWATEGSNLYLMPTPATSYTGSLVYYRHEPSLANDRSTPLIPAAFHDCVVARAAYLGAKARHDESKMATTLADYQLCLSRMIDNQDRAVGPPSISIRGF